MSRNGPEADFWPQNTDITFAYAMNRLPKKFRKLEVEAVVRRISGNDASHSVLALEAKGFFTA